MRPSVAIDCALWSNQTADSLVESMFNQSHVQGSLRECLLMDFSMSSSDRQRSTAIGSAPHSYDIDQSGEPGVRGAGGNNGHVANKADFSFYYFESERWKNRHLRPK
jgi:hypothetical protein